MKKTLTFLALLLGLSGSAWAQWHFPYTYGGNTLYYRISSDGSSVYVECPGGYYNNPWGDFPEPTGNLIIPDSITADNGNTYVVAAIGNYAFKNCTGLTSVTIPNSVTSIGQLAFEGCTGLTSVTIPASVTEIGFCAFCFCIGLTTVNFNATNCIANYSGVPYEYVRSIFYECTNLTTLNIGENVTTIPATVFAYCTGLTSVTIPNSVTSIGNSAFEVCSGLTSVTIGNSVTSIGDDAFYGCTGLTSLDIPNSVTHIGEKTFGNCSGLLSIVVDSGNAVFDSRNNCNAIIKRISNTLIAGCMNTVIPDAVTEIDKYAFVGCTGLTSVTIPNSVTSIGDYAFKGCSGLTSVTIGNSVTSIGYQAIYGCSGLTSVTIPNSVTSIGNSAFNGCSGLTTVNFNATNCTTMGSFSGSVFYGCTNLATLNIGANVTQIPSCAFKNCSGLTEIHSQAQVAPTLGEDVFFGVSSTIPLYVPCGRSAHYYSQWGDYFSNIIEEAAFTFNAVSSDNDKGTVQILTMPTCTAPNAVLYAVPNSGYLFDHWSTGSTSNPYSLTVTSDTVITAYFVSEGGGTDGITDVDGSNIYIYTEGGNIMVNGIENEKVQVFDMVGRPVGTQSLPTGVYMVKVGTLPARKVVVMR